MASWKKVIVSGSAISALNNDANYISSAGGGILSGSAQISADISGSLSAVAVAGLGANIVSGSAQVVALVEAGTDSNTFTDADHSKLNAIEASATADQTDAEIRAAVEAATDSNVFTDADHSKLNAIEASADVTDATNVTAAGALMDSELAEIATVKALTAAGISGSLSAAALVSLGANLVSGSAQVVALVEAGSDSNTFTDADHSKLNAIEASIKSKFSNRCFSNIRRINSYRRFRSTRYYNNY